MKEFKNYNELLKEESRLKGEIMVSRQKIGNQFSISHQAKNLFDGIKGVFSKDSSSPDGSLSHGFVETDTNKAKEEVVQLLIDLTYEAVAIALLRKPSNPKSFFNKSAAVSLKIVLKSILDQYYYNNKEKIAKTASNVVQKVVNKFSSK